MRKYVGPLAITLIGLLFMACAAPPAAPPTAAPPGEKPLTTAPKAPSTKGIEKINVAVATKGITYLPLFVATARGLYREEGLEVEQVIMKSNIATAALLSGSIDYVSPPGSILQSASQGAPVRVLMLFQNKPPWRIMAKDDIRSVKDLKGKSIGVGTKGSSTDFIVMKILMVNGLDPLKDAPIVGLGGDPNVRLGALKSGSVAALLETSPQLYIAEKQGAHSLVDSAEVAPEWPIGGLSTTMARLQDNPDQVRRILRATLKSMIFAQNNANKTETVNILTKELELEQDVASKSYDDFIRGMAKTGEISDKGLVTEFATLKEFGQLKGDLPQASKLADWTMLREVQKELKLVP